MSEIREITLKNGEKAYIDKDSEPYLNMLDYVRCSCDDIESFSKDVMTELQSVPIPYKSDILEMENASLIIRLNTAMVNISNMKESVKTSAQEILKISKKEKEKNK